MNNEMKVIKHIVEFFTSTKIFLVSLLKVLLSLLKFFLISPFIPLYDLGKDYLKIIKSNISEIGFKKLFSKKNSINEELIKYSISFLMLLFMVGYMVLGTPYGWYKSYINYRTQEKYINEFTDYYNSDIYGFTEKYSKDVYDWFNQYNLAYNNRDCKFMKYISVSLLQWEKNYIENIPLDKKYNEEFIYRDNYICNSFDNINIKSTWSPISINFEIKDTNYGKNKIIIANGYFAHSRVEDGNYIGLSRRKITLWKIDNWKTWRINNIETIN